MTTFSFDQLQRFPYAEAANLFAVDATDRLLLDEAAALLAQAGTIAVIGDHFGALTLGAASHERVRELSIRVHQDSLRSEQALANNAANTGLAGSYRNHAIDAELLNEATVVLVQAPKSLDGLADIAEAVARHAQQSVTLYVGGRVKHMTLAMNDVLRASFENVQAGRARQKSRVLVATGVRPAPTDTRSPRREYHEDLQLWLCAYGSAFAGTKVDIGTRYLLSFLGQMGKRADRAIDLGCGTGLLAASLARSRPAMSVVATDESAAAVASAVATMQANDLADRVEVTRDDAMSAVADTSVDLVLCNPPFHDGTSIDSSAAMQLFAAAGRVLRPAGELWTVFNSHLTYTGVLTHAVGPTQIVGRNPKFTVTRSIRQR